MARPSRSELLRKFFPELGETGTGGETEAAIAINTRACEAVLADLIGLFDESFKERGAGVLSLNLALQDRGGCYVTLDELCEDLLAADAMGQNDVSTMLKDIISVVRLNNYEEQVLLLLIDRSKASLLPVPRDHPARNIQRAQEAATL
jgi:hypothetical protein